MKKDKITILKVLVGSHAHGLADKNSDYDYRSVYVLPTSQILSLKCMYKDSEWNISDNIKENKDNTAYEIGHFLHLAMRCNPSILEVFKAPIVEINKDGQKLRNLFPYVWNPKDAFNAFVGYGLNQRKKFLDKKDNRQNKYAVAYIRTLYNLEDLLRKKDFEVEIKGMFSKNILKTLKKGNYTMGEVINYAEDLVNEAKDLLKNCNHESNIDKVNEFLIEIRKRYWK